MVATVSFRPDSLVELCQIVREHEKLRVLGSNGHADWRCDPDQGSPTLSTQGLNRIVEIQPADQIVKCEAGIHLAELQIALADRGFGLPFAPFEVDENPTIGGAISLALPHRLEGQHGSWRDWVLGSTVVRSDGTTAKCGSSAVKNVAGYDVVKLLIGARGTLGIITEVILRILPVGAIQSPAIAPLQSSNEPLWVQRVRLGDLARLPLGPNVDPVTATLWVPLACEAHHPRFPGDWIVRRGCGAQNLQARSHPMIIARAKAAFDPNAKFNQGAL